MSTDGFTLYSTAHISREEYMGWLHQLDAAMTPEQGDVYDARLSKDTRHVWISLLKEDELDMDMRELEEEPEVLANIRELLGGEPKSAIVLTANNVEGSQILAVQFAALCAEHYPCVVEQSAGHALFSTQELLELRDAGMGFDGYTWETANPARVTLYSLTLDEVKKFEEEKKRIQQNGGTPDDRAATASIMKPSLEDLDGHVVKSREQIQQLGGP